VDVVAEEGLGGPRNVLVHDGAMVVSCKGGHQLRIDRIDRVTGVVETVVDGLPDGGLARARRPGARPGRAELFRAGFGIAAGRGAAHEFQVASLMLSCRRSKALRASACSLWAGTPCPVQPGNLLHHRTAEQSRCRTGSRAPWRACWRNEASTRIRSPDGSTSRSSQPRCAAPTPAEHLPAPRQTEPSERLSTRWSRISTSSWHACTGLTYGVTAMIAQRSRTSGWPR
jgi:hypothetical protein